MATLRSNWRIRKEVVNQGQHMSLQCCLISLLFYLSLFLSISFLSLTLSLFPSSSLPPPPSSSSSGSGGHPSEGQVKVVVSVGVWCHSLAVYIVADMWKSLWVWLQKKAKIDRDVKPSLPPSLPAWLGCASSFTCTLLLCSVCFWNYFCGEGKRKGGCHQKTKKRGGEKHLYTQNQEEVGLSPIYVCFVSCRDCSWRGSQSRGKRVDRFTPVSVVTPNTDISPH